MTTEHDEAKTAGAIRMKHPLERGAMCWIFTDEQLAALIAEVRKEDAARVQGWPESVRAWARKSFPDISGDIADDIISKTSKYWRARLEEGK
jgi:hypothetical protein